MVENKSKEQTKYVPDCLEIDKQEYSRIVEETDRLGTRLGDFELLLKELKDLVASKEDLARGIYIGRRLEKAQKVKNFFRL